MVVWGFIMLPIKCTDCSTFSYCFVAELLFNVQLPVEMLSIVTLSNHSVPGDFITLLSKYFAT